MRLSKLHPEELFDLLEVAVREPTRVLQWIIANVERPLPWERFAELFEGGRFRDAMYPLLEGQALDGVDLAKAAAVLPRLGWNDGVTTDVVIEHVRAGRDDSAVGLLSASPTGRGFDALIAAHALLTGCDRTLAFLLAPTIGTSDELFAKETADEAAQLLKCAGQLEAALFLEQLAADYDEDCEHWSEEECDETGRGLAEKLCAAACPTRWRLPDDDPACATCTMRSMSSETDSGGEIRSPSSE
jgi:hypothetical protein